MKLSSEITQPFSDNIDIVTSTPGLASLAYAHSDSAWKLLTGTVFFKKITPFTLLCRTLLLRFQHLTEEKWSVVDLCQVQNSGQITLAYTLYI